VNPEGVLLQVSDDGRGLPLGVSAERLELEGHMGLAGMRERITALGGTVRLRAQGGTGALLEVLVPMPADTGA
jgi:signal transduction histidine kinase